jgi:hypothetical protein
MDPLESTVQLWEFSNPEDAYQAGLTSAAGRFFVRSSEQMEEVRRQCSEIEASLEQIPDQDLRATAYSLAQTIRLQIVRLYDRRWDVYICDCLVALRLPKVLSASYERQF